MSKDSGISIHTEAYAFEMEAIQGLRALNWQNKLSGETLNLGGVALRHGNSKRLMGSANALILGGSVQSVSKGMLLKRDIKFWSAP